MAYLNNDQRLKKAHKNVRELSKQLFNEAKN